MSGTLEYKGYVASIGFSSEDRCFFGKIEFINDLIMFEGTTVDELEAAFKDAVDSYLEFCEQNGKAPDQPFKGTFNVRIGETTHRRAAMEAKRQGQTLNDFVKRTIEERLDQRPVVHHLVHHVHKRVEELETEQTFTWSKVEQWINEDLLFAGTFRTTH